ncbi:MAG: ECF transporter S component, partial [Anaerolineae bacterium]
ASLLIHGTQGWVAGWISTRWQDTKGLVLASVIGGAIVVVGYLIAGTFFLGFGVALSEVPLNIIQVTVGAILAVPLFAAVRRAYPPIMNLGRGGQ